jgi:ATP-dependent Clp protease protease subunit
VISGLAVYDAIQHISSEVITVNLGLAASMASFLLCAGSRGRRFALPHSRVMIHQPMGGAQGQAEDIRVEASQIMRIKSNIVRMYSMMTGQSVEKIERDLDRYVSISNLYLMFSSHFLSALGTTSCLPKKRSPTA